MTKGRLEAFSDGVIAIIITIMVLELKAPHSIEFSAITPILPVFLSYVLSYIYVGIYWSNHHHLLHTITHSTGTIMWANLHLLFWLSLIPFVTAWMGENHFANAPTALYGLVLLMSAFAYWILQKTILSSHGCDSILAKAIGRDFKGNISIVLYLLGVSLSYFEPHLAQVIYVAVALLWLVPDRRIERVISS